MVHGTYRTLFGLVDCTGRAAALAEASGVFVGRHGDVWCGNKLGATAKSYKIMALAKSEKNRDLQRNNAQTPELRQTGYQLSRT